MDDTSAVHGVTVCELAQLAHAARLASAFIAQHEGTFTIYVVGADPDLPTEIRGHRPVDVRPAATLHSGRQTRADVLPWALSAALDDGRSPVVALSPTTVVVRSLASFAASATRSGISVVPRVLEPDRVDGVLDGGPVLAAGSIEPGLVACAEGTPARRLLRWWKCQDSDQHPLDLLPCFGATIVRDAGLGVSRWNLAERRLDDSAFGPFAADVPLRTYDLAGLEPDLPIRWSDDGRPSPSLAAPYVAVLAHAHLSVERIVA